MITLESTPRSKSGQFKERVFSHLDAIYGVALRLGKDEADAEELTVRAYETVCRSDYNQFSNSADLRRQLHRALIKAFLCYVNPMSPVSVSIDEC